MLDLQSRIDRLTEEQQMIRDSAASFFSDDGDLKGIRAQRGQQPGYRDERWQSMAELGWLGLMLPEEYDGMNLKFSEIIHLLEQSGRFLSPEPLVSTAVMGAGALLHGENDVCKSEYLPKLAAGEWKVAVAWQENIASMSLEAEAVTAKETDDGYVVSGKKLFIPSAGGADAFVISAKAGGRTILLLVNKEAEGVSVEFNERVDGGFFGTLSLNNVVVAKDRVIATAGVATLERVIEESRLAVSAELFGVMARALEITVDYIKQREQFGRPIGSFQALQHRAVDTFILVELSRSVLIQAAKTFDETEDTAARAKAASQVKARCSDAALQVTKSCIQMHGGIGYTDECNIGLYLKKAMVLAAWLGQATFHRTRYGELTNAA